MGYFPNINFYFNNKTPIITLKLGKEICTEDIDKFLQHYQFSKLKRGRFFLKRLIKKIIIKKHFSQIALNSNFWNNNEVKLVQISIKYNGNNAIEMVKESLSSNQSDRRINNIEKYETLIKNNTDLGFPLYIQRECLDENGPPIQLDGARRLMANVLNNKETYHIWLITNKENKNE
ncbi:MAG: hypothetical protein ISS11_04085 [Candidatus Marinimicrobia bacterium]|nr:hypothetical protein [Candidatus Neomarinimicrobiota bacterium]